MHDTASTSQEYFDDLQAPLNIGADTILDACHFSAAYSDQTNKGCSLNDDKELAVLLGMVSTSSVHSKEQQFGSKPQGYILNLPPPVRFSRANRKPIPSNRLDSMNM
jgi:hypothetical protein